MERIIQDEEKLRRAIEISQRRNNNHRSVVSTASVNVNEKKDYKLFKKMIIQIIICLLIYIIFHLIVSTNYVFSADVIQSANEILNYDINFANIYNNLMLYINSQTTKNSVVEQNNIQENTVNTNQAIIQSNEMENKISIDNSTQVENTLKEEIKNAESLNVEDETKIEENKNPKEEEQEEKKEISKTQEELDAEKVKKLCKFQKPLSGTITSEFGEREATIDGMTTDHKGIDIAANSGTSIKAAMDGKVTVAEQNSKYGKFIKILNGDVMTVYAHCKSLKVKVGDKIKKGQIIATVGSTGTSTGPHLHFEIRFENRYINPRLLIKF